MHRLHNNEALAYNLLFATLLLESAKQLFCAVLSFTGWPGHELTIMANP
jgi:hypothetical protein